MNRRLTLVWLAPLLLCARVGWAEIEIVGPQQPLEPGEYAQVLVRGIDEDHLPQAKVIYYPREKVICVPARTWGGSPFIWFGAKLPGRYLLAVVIPAAAGLEYAECVIEVGAPGPDPEPDPNPYRPAPQFKGLLAPVTALSVQSQDARRLATVTAQLAADVLKEGAGLDSSADLRAAVIERIGGLKLDYADLGRLLDGIYKEALGLEVRALDRQRAQALLITTAWALWQAGEAGS